MKIDISETEYAEGVSRGINHIPHSAPDLERERKMQMKRLTLSITRARRIIHENDFCTRLVIAAQKCIQPNITLPNFLHNL